MSRSNQISNVLALLLIVFGAGCLQARLTDQFTPDFAHILAAEMRPFNTEVFWWLGLTDEQLNLALAGLNGLSVLTLLLSSTRRFGFMVNFVYYEIGLIGCFVLGEGALPLVVLCSVSAGGFLLRSM